MKKILFSILLMVCFSAHAAREEGKKIRPLQVVPTPIAAPVPMPDLSKFFIGYNEAWFGQNYGSDLTTNYDADYIGKTLAGIQNAGGSVVRLWLLVGRQGIELATYAPQSKGVDAVMLKRVSDILQMARQRGIWVYLTLLDGNMPEDKGPVRDYYYNLLNNRYHEGEAFNTNVVGPLLQVMDKNRDVIYALDIMNEIKGPITRSYWSDRWTGPREWIRRTTTFIKSKSPWLKVTSSAGWGTAAFEITIGFFSGLGLNFYDLHLYSDSGTYFGKDALCDRIRKDGVPMILGEFGQKTRANDDQLQASSTAKFLSMAKSSCFSGALAWRYDAAEAWWNYAKADGSYRPAVDVIRRFSNPLLSETTDRRPVDR